MELCIINSSRMITCGLPSKAQVKLGIWPSQGGPAVSGFLRTLEILGSNLTLDLNPYDSPGVATWDRDALLRFGVPAQVLRVRVGACSGCTKKNWYLVTKMLKLLLTL